MNKEKSTRERQEEQLITYIDIPYFRNNPTYIERWRNYYNIHRDPLILLLMYHKQISTYYHWIYIELSRYFMSKNEPQIADFVLNEALRLNVFDSAKIKEELTKIPAFEKKYTRGDMMAILNKKNIKILGRVWNSYKEVFYYKNSQLEEENFEISFMMKYEPCLISKCVMDDDLIEMASECEVFPIVTRFLLKSKPKNEISSILLCDNSQAAYSLENGCNFVQKEIDTSISQTPNTCDLVLNNKGCIDECVIDKKHENFNNDLVDNSSLQISSLAEILNEKITDLTYEEDINSLKACESKEKCSFNLFNENSCNSSNNAKKSIESSSNQKTHLDFQEELNHVPEEETNFIDIKKERSDYISNVKNTLDLNKEYTNQSGELDIVSNKDQIELCDSNHSFTERKIPRQEPLKDEIFASCKNSYDFSIQSSSLIISQQSIDEEERGDIKKPKSNEYNCIKTIKGELVKGNEVIIDQYIYLVQSSNTNSFTLMKIANANDISSTIVGRSYILLPCPETKLSTFEKIMHCDMCSQNDTFFALIDFDPILNLRDVITSASESVKLFYLEKILSQVLMFLDHGILISDALGFYIDQNFDICPDNLIFLDNLHLDNIKSKLNSLVSSLDLEISQVCLDSLRLKLKEPNNRREVLKHKTDVLSSL